MEEESEDEYVVPQEMSMKMLLMASRNHSLRLYMLWSVHLHVHEWLAHFMVKKTCINKHK